MKLKMELDVTPAEMRELIGADNIQEAQQKMATEVVKQFTEQFAAESQKMIPSLWKWPTGS